MYKKFKETYQHYAEVKQQCLEIIENYGDWDNNSYGQISIQTNIENENRWYDSTGQAIEKSLAWEKSFCYLQPELKNTAIEDYLKWLSVPVYRTRIMLSHAKSSYSIHRDFSPRLHLPLVTNSQCNFLFAEPPLQLIHMPANGETYWVDTTRLHTFLNGSTEKRYHLVMITEK